MPFSDRRFIHTYWSVIPELRKNPIEKFLLRKAFSTTGLLPDEILWRQKEAFSDGVSIQNRSWKTVIQEFVNEEVSYREYKDRKCFYKHCMPNTVEAYYYRKIFESQFQNAQVIPYFWMPHWVDPSLLDPSARELSNYNATRGYGAH
jgi:asparagine synthase (glutamine-hydrolysing)